MPYRRGVLRQRRPSSLLTSTPLPFERLEHRLKIRLIVSPSADRAGMDGPANLRQAGRAHDARIGVEVKARRVPFKTNELDQAPGMMFQVGDQVFVRDVEQGQGPDAFPVRHDPLIIRQSTRDLVPVVVPRTRTEAGLPAREGDVARIAAANDTSRRGNKSAIKPR